MTRSPRFLILASLALAALLALPALPVSAQQASEEAGQAPVFGETIDVRVVNVEVVVTDRDGNRVAGLGPDDLRLYVDGGEVPIAYFTEIRGGDAVAPAAGADAVPGLPALAPGEPVGTSYLVFIDDYFPIQRDRNRVLQALADDLPNLGPGDRMAVVAFDGREIEMLSSWTSSRPELERALRRAEERPAYGLQWIGLQRSFENAFGRRVRPQAALLTSSFDPTVDERGFAYEIRQRVEREVAAATATLRAFAQPPGRKVMILLSGGWPFSSAQFAVNDLGRPLVGFGYDDSIGVFAPLTDTANLLGYTLYPVDVPGLGGDFGAEVERETRFATELEIEPSLAAFERERLLQDSLYYLARETGGRALINSKRLAALPEVATDTRSYYWIGFVPDRNRDNALHEIRVEAVDASLRARTRESFRDLSWGVENDMAVESALLFGAAPAAGRILVEAGEPERVGRKYIELPLRLVIPADAVTTLPENGELVARLELRVAARDSHKRSSEIYTVPFELRVAADAPAGAVVVYDTRVKLRNDEQDLVVSVHDPLSNQNLMARLEVAP